MSGVCCSRGKITSSSRTVGVGILTNGTIDIRRDAGGIIVTQTRIRTTTAALSHPNAEIIEHLSENNTFRLAHMPDQNAGIVDELQVITMCLVG